MANINEYGYQSIRQYVIDSWKFVELQDEDGETVKRFMEKRVKVGTDGMGRPIYETEPGATISGDPTTQTITLTVVASGDEFTGKTVAKVALFDVDTGGKPIASESLSNSFTFESAEDELTVNFNLQIPKVN
ncbi:hypothetical protein MUB24_12860 [Lederbergia sp. NSJ-179]|uniref:hypothetical protein n=1 Tax=Lederbergia sp. NSJ-179 TaxID=2931402 RepID=UPI001FD400E1|nr:hypothetical protein [Lederbergia sp. NSJ-179]MCJ7841773.1 hypothetical protein [Lederbergia sp. NSJ-179]